MSQPKRQHFLAENFLSGFTNSQDQIYMLDGKKNSISSRNISSVAQKKHLYTVFEGDIKNYALENRFAEIESVTAPLLKKIRASDFSSLSSEDISELINFIVLTFIRTPQATLLAEETVRDLRVQKEMRDIDRNAAENYISRCLEQRGLSYATMLPSYFEDRYQVITHNFDVFLLTKEEAAPPFVLNDMFLCVEAVSKKIHYTGGRVDWRKSDVKKHFPVSSRHCVSFVRKSDPDRFGGPEMRVYKTAISVNDVLVLNQLAVRQKNRYAYCASADALRY